MKSVLSGIDLLCVLRELSMLEGVFLDRVYQVGNEFVFHFKKNRAKFTLRVIIGKLIHLTEFVKENPGQPSNFCMYLRKYLVGAKLLDISQPCLERVVVLRFGGPMGVIRVYFELFGTGNVVVTDDAARISQCLKFQRFSAREVRPGVLYKLPPSVYDLSVNDLVSFTRLFKSGVKPDVVRVLAISVGLGGDYAEEVCLRSGVDKSLKPESLSDAVIKSLHDSVSELLRLARSSVLEARVLVKGDVVVDVSPFPLRFYDGVDFKPFPSYNSALDFFYAHSERADFEARKVKIVEDKRKALSKKLSDAKGHVDLLKSEAARLRRFAEVLRDNSFVVEKVLSGLLGARRANRSWKSIISDVERSRDSGSEEALLIREVRPDDNLVVLELAGGIEVSLSAKVSDVVSDFFLKAKRAEGKLPGALEALKRVEDELSSVSPDSVKDDVVLPKRVDSSSKEWFTRFKWFRAFDGKLCISGRNALQNEELINRYLEPGDLVFHADVHGSPFTLLRGGQEASEDVKLSAASFTAAHSSAWRASGAIDVYYVLPSQVSKTPASGEYLKTGGFVISGRKVYFRNLKPELCVGVELIGELNYRLVSGPVSVIAPRCVSSVVLEPGNSSVTELAHELVDFFKGKTYAVKFEDVQACLPGGNSRVTKFN